MGAGPSSQRGTLLMGAARPARLRLRTEAGGVAEFTFRAIGTSHAETADHGTGGYGLSGDDLVRWLPEPEPDQLEFTGPPHVDLIKPDGTATISIAGGGWRRIAEVYPDANDGWVKVRVESIR